MKLFRHRLLMFFSKFVQKTPNYVFESHFREVRGDPRPWLMVVGKPMVDFLFALIELFGYPLRFGRYTAKFVQLGCIHKGRPLCTQILPGQGRHPSTILGVRKLETLG